MCNSIYDSSETEAKREIFQCISHKSPNNIFRNNNFRPQSLSPFIGIQRNIFDFVLLRTIQIDGLFFKEIV